MMCVATLGIDRALKTEWWNVDNSLSFIQSGTELVRFTKMNMGKQVILWRNGYIFCTCVVPAKSRDRLVERNLQCLVSISKFKIALKNAWHSRLNLNER